MHAKTVQRLGIRWWITLAKPEKAHLCIPSALVETLTSTSHYGYLESDNENMVTSLENCYVKPKATEYQVCPGFMARFSVI